MGAASELERLVALRDRGVLSPEEFATQKQRILGAPVASARPADDLDGDGIGDLWVFALMLVPLLAAVFVAYAAGNGSTNSVRGPFLFLNLLFLINDHGRLKSADRRLPLWQLVVGFLFIPLYLFFRARRLLSGYGYIAMYLVALLAPILAVWSALPA